MEPYKIEFADYGDRLGTHFIGVNIRVEIETNFNTTNKFIFDFTGVESVSGSFTDECFGKLLFKFNIDDLKKKFAFQNSNSFIKAKITEAFKERFKKILSEKGLPSDYMSNITAYDTINQIGRSC